MDVLYFAWMRERIGRSSEQVDTTGMTTARDLVEHLKDQGRGYELAFEKMDAVRVAIDQEVATLDSPIGQAREIAFFPPVTGG
ncbi:MAG: molybdopterin converting factor subunit 1 [Pseudomonadota bacterium]